MQVAPAAIREHMANKRPASDNKPPKPKPHTDSSKKESSNTKIRKQITNNGSASSGNLRSRLFSHQPVIHREKSQKYGKKKKSRGFNATTRGLKVVRKIEARSQPHSSL